MTVSNAGLARIVTLITSDIDDGRAGTGTTLPTPSDTDLETPVANTEADVDIVTSSSSFSVTHVVTATSGNGSDLSEWHTRMNSEATQLSRVVTASISKTASIEISKITLFNVLGE